MHPMPLTPAVPGRWRLTILAALALVPLWLWTPHFAAAAQGTPAGQPAAASEAAKPKPSPEQAKPLAPSFHLIYTLSESEAGKRLGVEHYTLTVSSDRYAPAASLRVNSRVLMKMSNDASQLQTYEIALNIRAQTLGFDGGAVEIFSSVEQTSVVAPQQESGHPVPRTATLETTALLYPGKPVMLGSFDVPGSVRHHDVEVVLEPTR